MKYNYVIINNNITDNIINNIIIIIRYLLYY